MGGERFVYSRAPFLIYWELTRACDLACRHCRAEAIKSRDILELGTEEAEDLLEAMREFGSRRPHLVFTGGDALKRPDLFDLLEYAVWAGFPVSVAPSATYALKRAVLERFKKIGVESMALSLDGSNAEKHDGFRGVPGCFEWTLAAARDARALGLSLQINTLVTTETADDLPEIFRVVRGLGIARWSLFFLIGVGRGRALNEVTPERCEALCHWLYDLSSKVSFAIKTTEALHFRRIALLRMRAEGISLAKILETPLGKGFGIRDGNGIMFVAHNGDVYPSGFLPLSAGNVRTARIAEIYRESELFTSIRASESLKGRCGRCEFKRICGGSRARAYARYGDPLESDPLCAYEPGSYKRELERLRASGEQQRVQG